MYLQYFHNIYCYYEIHERHCLSINHCTSQHNPIGLLYIIPLCRYIAIVEYIYHDLQYICNYYCYYAIFLTSCFIHHILMLCNPCNTLTRWLIHAFSHHDKSLLFYKILLICNMILLRCNISKSLVCLCIGAETAEPCLVTFYYFCRR